MLKQNEACFIRTIRPFLFTVKVIKNIIPVGLILWSSFIGSICLADDIKTDSTPAYIDSIEINNQNIFNVDSAKYDHWIYKLANKLHIKTKKYVIKRELLLKKGDIYSRRLARESERNLRVLPYLWNARVSLYRSGDSLNIMRVTTSDSWTLLGGFSISRGSDELIYHLRIEELNFLGLGQTLSLHYYIREFREDYAQLSFLERRLFGSRQYLNLYIDDDPEVGMKGVAFGRPFFSLDSKIQYSINYTDLDRRRNIYAEGGKISAWEQVSGRWLEIANYYRLGSYHNKILLGLNYRYIDFGPTDSLIIEPNKNNDFSRDSLYWYIAPDFGLYNLRYISTRRINTFQALEDILLEKGISLNTGWAFDASSGNNIYRLVSFTGHYYQYIDSNLFFADFKHSRWFDGNTTFRKAYSLSIKYYNNYLKWLTPMFRAVYSSDDIRDIEGTLYLGENNGLRGYPRNYSTGDKRLLVNIENRFFSGLELLSIDLGAVQFIDIGRCWPGNEGIRLRDLYWSVGIGLRLSAERISGAKLMRLDLAYAGELKEWQLSFGVGHYVE